MNFYTKDEKQLLPSLKGYVLSLCFGVIVGISLLLSGLLNKPYTYAERILNYESIKDSELRFEPVIKGESK